MLNNDTKEIASDLAEKISAGYEFSKEEIKVIHNLFPSNLIEEKSDLPQQNNEKSIGIWKEKNIDGNIYYVRDVGDSENSYSWSELEKIPPKSNLRRIIFLGESVARGYLLCPTITPAGILKDILKENEEEFEILDMTRSSMGMEELRDLCKAVIQLQPDCIILFAGNNWRNSIWPFGSAESERLCQECLESKEFIERIENFHKEKLESVVKDFFEPISGTFSQTRCIFVIPESNIVDWIPTENERIPIWINGNDDKWYKLLKECETESDAMKNIDNIKMLISLAPLSPVGYFLMGRALQKLSRAEEAKKYFVEARNKGIYLSLFSVPYCYSYEADLIKKYCKKYDIEILDLRESFADYLQGELPGNNLFLDYCHLNVNGIKIAMEAVTKKIFKLFSIPKTNLKKITIDQKQQNKAMGAGHFLAALHCAHICKQQEEIIEYHCKEALKYWPKIKETMYSFLNLASKKVPWVVNKESRNLIKSELLKSYPLLYQPKNSYLMEEKIVKAIVKALKDYGEDIEYQIKKEMVSNFSFKTNKLNLLETYYRDNAYQMSDASIGYFTSNKRAFISSIEPTSVFYLVVSDNTRDIKVNFTSRLPYDYSEELSGTIGINGNKIDVFMITGKWKNYTFNIDAKFLHVGINIVEINWPYIAGSINTYYEKIRQNYTGYDLYLRFVRPVYSDIARLVVFPNKEK